MASSLRRQVDIGILTDAAFCLGTGKNFDRVSQLNAEGGFFNLLSPLEHPRYVIQYKTRQMQQ